MFPGGISGKQPYIYKNTSNPSQNVTYILDRCEIEILGIYNAIISVKYKHKLIFEYILYAYLLKK